MGILAAGVSFAILAFTTATVIYGVRQLIRYSDGELPVWEPRLRTPKLPPGPLRLSDDE